MRSIRRSVLVMRYSSGSVERWTYCGLTYSVRVCVWAGVGHEPASWKRMLTDGMSPCRLRVKKSSFWSCVIEMVFLVGGQVLR